MSYGVLIVEDKTSLAKNIKVYLTRYDYDVHVAGTIEEGIREIESFRPDVVLLDLKLPDGDGFDVLSHISKGDLEVRACLEMP